MKVILNEKITRLGNIGDAVDVATGYARNYLLPNGKAMRWSKENMAVFEAKKAELVARHESAKSAAEGSLDKVKSAKLHLIRSAGDTGRLYGGVSSRDIARLMAELTGIELASEQVLLGQPIKEIGVWDIKIALHPDVIADVKVYVAQTQDEIEALLAGKSIKKEAAKIGSDPAEIAAKMADAKPAPADEPADETESADTPIEETPAAEPAAESAE